jgi:hypothetical protein
MYKLRIDERASYAKQWRVGLIMRSVCMSAPLSSSSEGHSSELSKRLPPSTSGSTFTPHPSNTTIILGSYGGADLPDRPNIGQAPAMTLNNSCGEHRTRGSCLAEPVDADVPSIPRIHLCVSKQFFPPLWPRAHLRYHPPYGHLTDTLVYPSLFAFHSHLEYHTADSAGPSPV